MAEAQSAAELEAADFAAGAAAGIGAGSAAGIDAGGEVAVAVVLVAVVDGDAEGTQSLTVQSKHRSMASAVSKNS